MANIHTLRQERTALTASASKLLDQINDESFTGDKAALEKEYTETEAKIDAKIVAITRAEKLAAIEAAAPANEVAKGKAFEVPDGTKVAAGVDTSKQFQSFGQFIQNIAFAGMSDDPKRQAAAVEALRIDAAASGINTTVGAEGGFAVRKDFSTALLERAQEESNLYQLCEKIPVGDGFDGIQLPYIDETSRATGSRWGGVQVYRTGETDNATPTKPKFGYYEIKLEDLRGLCYVSERALADATSLGAIMEKGFSSEFAFVLDDEVMRGTGAGQCLGILNAAYKGTVSVAKETGQAAKTVQFENITKMRARMLQKSRGKMVWLINNDVEPALAGMSLAIGTAGVPVYMPAGGISGDGYDTLFGRPVIPIEQAETLGTVGDIIAADFSQYGLIEKGGLVMDSSMHVRFIYHEMAFRFSHRINGQPLVKQAITPYKGAASLSPFVTLATRA